MIVQFHQRTQGGQSLPALVIPALNPLQSIRTALIVAGVPELSHNLQEPSLRWQNSLDDWQIGKGMVNVALERFRYLGSIAEWGRECQCHQRNTRSLHKFVRFNIGSFEWIG